MSKSETDPPAREDIRPLVRGLGKPPAEWQRWDLERFCLEHRVRVVNLRYPSLDGKLRELRLPVNDRRYLDRILAAGERVDGSSLFPGLFDAGESAEGTREEDHDSEPLGPLPRRRGRRRCPRTTFTSWSAPTTVTANFSRDRSTRWPSTGGRSRRRRRRIEGSA